RRVRPGPGVAAADVLAPAGGSPGVRRRAPLAARPRVEPAQGPIADAAPRDVDHPPQAGPIRGIVGDPQVREEILDLRPLVEPEAADDLVGDPEPQEHLLELSGLGVRAVEDGDLAGLAAGRPVGADEVAGVPGLI